MLKTSRVVKSFITSLLVIVTFQGGNECLAYPTGAGSCNTGRAVGVPHSTTGKGELSENGYEMLINGNVLDSSTVFNTGAPGTYTLTLNAPSDEFFKGFLFRLSSSDGLTDVSDVLTLTSDQEDTAKLFPHSPIGFEIQCPMGVAAATHRFNLQKSTVSVTLDYDDTAGLTLEVTVVRNNNILAGFNDWYTSSYELTFSEDVPMTTPAPTPSSVTSAPTPLCRKGGLRKLGKRSSLLSLLLEHIQN